MQQGILFHALYEPEPGVYLVALSWTLRGELDAAALQRAWQEACDRHTVLRTAFAWERLDRPVQIVRKRVELTIEQGVTCARCPQAERAARAAAREEELGRRGFGSSPGALPAIAARAAQNASRTTRTASCGARTT